MEITDFSNPPNEIEVKVGVQHYLALTAFDFYDVSVILGIELDETVSMVVRSSGLRAEVLKLDIVCIKAKILVG